jgi:lipopolysaccharide transport system permease protein
MSEDAPPSIAAAAGPAMPAPAVLCIEPRPGWRSIDLRELWDSRDLLVLLVWRDLKARYAQSILGLGWAILRPVISMLIFTLIFGSALRIDSDGAPYPLFSYVGVAAWIYFSTSVSSAAGSLVVHREMLSKVYFPRLLMPLSYVLAQFVDFCISIALLLPLMGWYGLWPGAGAVVAPVFVFLMLLSSAGIGFWLSALAVQYRDVHHATGFLLQLGMYLSPVVYPIAALPESIRYVYAVNPMVGVIEGLRAALLSTGPVPWDLTIMSAFVSVALAVSGASYFRRVERAFADVA